MVHDAHKLGERWGGGGGVGGGGQNTQVCPHRRDTHTPFIGRPKKVGPPLLKHDISSFYGAI